MTEEEYAKRYKPENNYGCGCNSPYVAPSIVCVTVIQKISRNSEIYIKESTCNSCASTISKNCISVSTQVK